MTISAPSLGDVIHKEYQKGIISEENTHNVDNYTLKKFLSRKKKKKNPDQLAEKYGNFLETRDKMNPNFRDVSGH